VRSHHFLELQGEEQPHEVGVFGVSGVDDPLFRQLDQTLLATGGFKLS